MTGTDPARLIALLETLTAIPGLAGHEDAIARALAERLAPLAADVHLDALGNVIAPLRGPADGPRVAVLAHMDTVGLAVKTVSAEGMLRVVPVGGVNLKALPGAAVRVGDVSGVVGVRSQHQARPGDETVREDDLYVQVAPEAVTPISVTAPVTYAPQCLRLGEGVFAAPYLDNRASCAALVTLAERLADAPLPCQVTLIGTVQEETTCAGALAALRAVAPDVALFVDGTLSYDTPETRGQGAVTLGGGPVLTSFLYVSGLNGWHAHPGLRAHLLRVAAEAGLPTQQDAIRGLISDARAATWLGIPSAVIGLPLRGKHAPLEMMHLGDLIHAVALLVAALSRPLPVLTRG
ncbi:MAG: M42 family metallopeptidase [Anaerolineae bacterium]